MIQDYEHELISLLYNHVEFHSFKTLHVHSCFCFFFFFHSFLKNLCEEEKVLAPCTEGENRIPGGCSEDAELKADIEVLALGQSHR